MPNHVSNTLEIYIWHSEGAEEAIEETKGWLKGDEDVIDFAAIVPPPENMFTGDLSEADRKECAAKGIPNWYDWRCDNWGTKWNAYDAYIEEETGYTLIYKFDTAWSPPEPVIAALRGKLEEKYPYEKGWEVSVRGGWVEEGWQSAGVY